MKDKEARTQIASVTSDREAQQVYEAYRKLDGLSPAQAAEKVIRMATQNYPPSR
jgi:hypothetical protein